MQLYIIGPLILFQMIKWKHFRKFGIPLLIMICDLWTAVDSYVNKYRAGSLIDNDYRTEDTNLYVYITTQSRFSGWMLGLYLGYVLQELEDAPKKISKITLLFGWSLTALTHLLAVLSLYYFIRNPQHNYIVDSLYNGFHRTIFSASICWLIYACASGYGGLLRRFLTWYPLQVLGRLTYATYLTQLAVLQCIDAMTLTTLQYQPYMDLRIAISNVILCFVVAFHFSLMFELPYINLGKILIPAKTKEDKMKIENNKPQELYSYTSAEGQTPKDHI